MVKRTIRVVKWLSTTPAVAVCTDCAREFTVPMSALTRTSANMQEQFDRHRCEIEPTGREVEQDSGENKGA